MRFRIEFLAEAERDFALIFDHLFDSCAGYGLSRASSAPSGRGATAACGRVSVPEDHDRPDGRRIDLSFTVLNIVGEC